MGDCYMGYKGGYWEFRLWLMQEHVRSNYPPGDFPGTRVGKKGLRLSAGPWVR